MSYGSTAPSSSWSTLGGLDQDEYTFNLLMICAAGSQQAFQQILAKYLSSIHLPYAHLYASACILCALLCTAILWTRAFSPPDGLPAGWLAIRAVSSAGKSIMGILAVLCGVGVGDAAALYSVVTLAGAVMGALTVGDRFTWTHIGASVLTTCGVVLMTSPALVFDSGFVPTALVKLGYCFALLAGILHACQAVAARKCQALDSLAQSLICYPFLIAVMLVIKLPLFPEHRPVETLMADPVVALSGLVGVTVTLFLTGIMGAHASSRLPVSLTTTALLSSRIVVGYLADKFIFDAPITRLGVVGAILILIGSVAIASVPNVKEVKEEEKVKQAEDSGLLSRGLKSV